MVPCRTCRADASDLWLLVVAPDAHITGRNFSTPRRLFTSSLDPSHHDPLGLCARVSFEVWVVVCLFALFCSPRVAMHVPMQFSAASATNRLRHCAFETAVCKKKCTQTVTNGAGYLRVVLRVSAWGRVMFEHMQQQKSVWRWAVTLHVGKVGLEVVFFYHPAPPKRASTSKST